MFSPRRLIAFLCVVAVLLAAVSPVAPGLAWAILVPLLLFVVVVVAPAVRDLDDLDPATSPFLSALPSRAPPLA
jgi:hypothetical protein